MTQTGSSEALDPNRQRECAVCGEVFTRRRTVGVTEWSRARYCSPECHRRRGPGRPSLCARGHDQTDPANVYVYQSGLRRCRVCARLKDAERRRANRVEPNPAPKSCSRCGQNQSADQFRPRRGRFERYPWCRTCERRLGQEYDKAHPELKRERGQRNYYAKQDEAIHKSTLWNRANKERVLNGRYIRKFGITLDEYEQMLSDQGGMCAACGLPETAKVRQSNKIRRYHVDHNHDTGEVRGLLCTGCNVALGLLHDNADRAERLAAYRRRYR